MKKIATAVAAMAMAATMFAVDFSATVQMDTSVANGTLDLSADDAGKFDDATVSFLTMKEKEQKDADALEVHFAGDKAGADFKFWYNYTGSGAEAFNVRGVDVWFTPIDQVKIVLGDIDEGMYKEQIFWWHVAAGIPVSTFKSPSWSSNTSRPWCGTASATGSGVSVTVLPVDGLTVNLAVAPGAGNAFTDTKEYGMFGASVKYNIADGITAGVAYRDDGYKAPKVITVGGDYAAGDFYGMVQAKALIDSTTLTVYDKVYTWDQALTGVSIDNYWRYNFGFMKLEAHLPVTIRGLFTPMIGKTSAYDVLGTTAAAMDPSYMAWQLKVSIPLDSYLCYVMIGDETEGNGNEAPVIFNDTLGDTFGLQLKIGAEFNVGVAALNAALTLNFKDGFDSLAWAVPFTAKVAF